MTKRRYADGLVWLFLSLLLGIKSVQLGLGAVSSPGPGFIPFLLALCLFSLSLLLLIQASLLSKEKVALKWNLRMSVFYVVFSIGVYVFFFKKIGFLLSTFLLMTFLFRWMGTKRWLWALGKAILVTLLSYLFFGVILQLNLPAGIF